MRCWKSYFVLLAAIAASRVGAAASAAELGPLARYMTDDVVAVGCLNLAKLDLPKAVDELGRFGVVSDGEVQASREKLARIQQVLDELREQGAGRAFVLLRTSDFAAGGPTWVIEVAEEGDADRVRGLIDGLLEVAGTNRSASKLGDPVPHELVVEGKLVLGAPSAERLEEIKQMRAGAQRQDADAALQWLTDADAGFVAFGDADSRRVLREMFPQLPGPFAEIDGRLIADGVSWAGAAVKLPPGPQLMVTLEAAEPAVAATLEQSATKGLDLLKALCAAELIGGPPAHKARAGALLPLIPHLQPKIEGTRLMLALLDDQAELDAVRNIVVPGVVAGREAAQRATRMNNFKQIAIAMYNYDAVHKSFPASASYNADGKPLLSWRVHVLPYLEQLELYNEFHLDEPWDSEHNRKLVERMPAVYADPDPAVQRAVGAGRTTTLVPTGPGTVFDRREGTKLTEISDGTSFTILAVEAIPERAIVWTKPEDWEVDFSDPLWGVKRGGNASQRRPFAAAMCDGSVRAIFSNVDPKVFASQLTRAADDAVQP